MATATAMNAANSASGSINRANNRYFATFILCSSGRPAMLASARQSSKVCAMSPQCAEIRRAAYGTARSPAYISGGGGGLPCRYSGGGPTADQSPRLPKACKTCSISTPSSSWRSRCSSSCACAACSVNAPGASGRLTIPIRRASRRGRPRDKVVALPNRKPEAVTSQAGRAGGAGGRALEGRGGAGLGDRRRARRHCRRRSHLRSQAFPDRRARRLRDDRQRLCRGRPPHAQEPAVARRL